MEKALAKQGKASTSIHSPLDQLYLGDLPFGLSLTERGRDGVADGGDIPLNACGKGSQFLHAAGLGILEPRGQLRDVLMTEHPPKLMVPAEDRAGLGAQGEQREPLRLLCLSQMRGGTYQEPAHLSRGEHRHNSQERLFLAPLRDQSPDDGRLSAKALFADLVGDLHRILPRLPAFIDA